MRVALERAWESACAGSLGIGAVVTDRRGAIVATGRNRLAEHDAGDDVLAGSSLAHAEMNALAKLRWGAHRRDELALWTTLEPCVQCAGAIRIGPIAAVHVLAPDPLFRDVARIATAHDHVALLWPSYHHLPADPHAAFALLLPVHTFSFWGALDELWSNALPGICDLGAELAARRTPVDLAASGASLDDVLHELWPVLTEVVGDVDALWSR